MPGREGELLRRRLFQFSSSQVQRAWGQGRASPPTTLWRQRRRKRKTQRPVVFRGPWPDTATSHLASYSGKAGSLPVREACWPLPLSMCRVSPAGRRRSRKSFHIAESSVNLFGASLKKKKMEHEMNAMEKEQTPKNDALDAGMAGTSGKRSLTSHVDFGALPSQGPVMRSKQRAQKHALVRPWKSLPPTPSGLLEKNQKVFFSSLTSLQAEEFFDMVATIQARRLNDQRADFAGPEAAGEETPGISEDQLYDTILAHQSQRLEDQRTEPPIPVGIQGLLDLLLTAQGTRMEDQRSALPPGLAAPPLLGRQPSFLHGL